MPGAPVQTPGAPSRMGLGASVSVSRPPTPTVAGALTEGTAPAALVTAAVLTDHMVVVAYPGAVAVVVTRTYLPMSALVGVYVVPVAPRMGTSLRTHWCVRVASEGSQAPSKTLRVLPTNR